MGFHKSGKGKIQAPADPTQKIARQTPEVLEEPSDRTSGRSCPKSPDGTHHWDRDGERCELCGIKDWMTG